MIILILGNNYSALSFYNLFIKNKQNIVFSTNKKCANSVDFQDNNDIIDFIEANGVSFVLITDISLLNYDLEEELSKLNISVFCPSKSASEICFSKSTAKKFLYKNKIATPRFQIIEKIQQGLEYIKTNTAVQAIKPEFTTFKEGVKFAETYSQGQEIINNLFRSGNKKILIEDYIEGKNFSVWTLSNGYDAKIIFTSAKYLEEVSCFNPDFLDDEIKEQIEKDFIKPTLNALNAQGEEYIGILGFDFILTFDKKLYLINYNSFFDDINVDFATQGFDIDWADVFERTIRGDVFLKYNFENHKNFMACLKQKENIAFQSAQTKSTLQLYLRELNYDLEILKEAQKRWKY